MAQTGKNYDQILDEELSKIGLTHDYFIHPDNVLGYNWVEDHVIERIEHKKFLGLFTIKSKVLVARIHGEASCAYPFHSSQGKSAYNYSGLDIKIIDPIYGFLLRSTKENLEAKLREPVNIKSINDSGGK